MHYDPKEWPARAHIAAQAIHAQKERVNPTGRRPSGAPKTTPREPREWRLVDIYEKMALLDQGLEVITALDSARDRVYAAGTDTLAGRENDPALAVLSDYCTRVLRDRSVAGLMSSAIHRAQVIGDQDLLKVLRLVQRLMHRPETLGEELTRKNPKRPTPGPTRRSQDDEG